jgi:hypothetical protein
LSLIALDLGSQNALRRTAKGGSEFKRAERWNGSKPDTPRDTEISTADMATQERNATYGQVRSMPIKSTQFSISLGEKA